MRMEPRSKAKIEPILDLGEIALSILGELERMIGRTCVAISN
jgi:hypothetical protein